MSNFPILSLLVFLPFFGSIFILMIKGEAERADNNARVSALFVTLSTFLLSLVLLFSFDKVNPAPQFVEKYQWLAGYNIFYHLGVDGISLLFVILTTFLMPICILASWNSITTRVKEYMAAFLWLETMIIGVFCSLDFVLFYIFFEAVLIPMFIIIGVWGGENRVYASFKFFLYTLAGSVLLLVAMIFIYTKTNTADIFVLMHEVPKFDLETQKWLWLMFLASFAVKVPMWPVHTWLPDAHVQAPTAGSVILAGVLLKLGGYGMIRLMLPMLPDASHYYTNLIYALSITAVIYTSLVALRQDDMKKLIAYSSVAHMGFVTIGLFTFNKIGIVGSIVVMLSHGLVSAALFLCVGVLYDRMHTKEIAKYGGVVNKMPVFAAVFMLFTLASIGLPGTSGFVGEMLVLLGAFLDNKIVAAFAATGVILGAAYMLWLYRRVVFGEIVNKEVAKLQDLCLREVLIFAPIIILVIVIGIYPVVVNDYLTASVNSLLSHLAITINN